VKREVPIIRSANRGLRDKRGRNDLSGRDTEGAKVSKGLETGTKLRNPEVAEPPIKAF